MGKDRSTDEGNEAVKIEQSAGGCEICVYTDGWPLWPVLRVKAINGEATEARLCVSDLHDLRYCIDRVLAQLPKDRS